LDALTAGFAHRIPLGDIATDRLIKETISICPECLCKIPATVVERNRKVYMLKTCLHHGDYSVLLASDVRHYYVANPNIESSPACCGSGQHCGDQVSNHSCNLLIEITQSCNLTCPTCYASSSPQHKTFMTLEKFEETIDGLISMGKGDADLIQLSGGEPTIHPQFFDFIGIALAKGVQQVYINTNGLYLAKPGFAKRLAAYGPRVCVYLQFDGLTSNTHTLLRGRDLGDIKQRAMQACERLGINTIPVMTMVGGINDHEIGAFLEFAQANTSSVHKVMIQPAMYSGRNSNPLQGERLTLAEVIKCIVKQTDGVFSEEDFTPIPCSDPNCFSMAVAIRTATGLVPVSRFLPRYKDWANEGISQLIAAVSDTFDSAGSFSDFLQKVIATTAVANLSDESVDSLLGLIASLPAQPGLHNSEDWNPLFAIGIKPFMDAYTYDQDRIDKCCTHIVSAQGQPISFCEYNAIKRPSGKL